MIGPSISSVPVKTFTNRYDEDGYDPDLCRLGHDRGLGVSADGDLTKATGDVDMFVVKSGKNHEDAIALIRDFDGDGLINEKDINASTRELKKLVHKEGSVKADRLSALGYQPYRYERHDVNSGYGGGGSDGESAMIIRNDLLTKVGDSLKWSNMGLFSGHSALQELHSDESGGIIANIKR